MCIVKFVSDILHYFIDLHEGSKVGKRGWKTFCNTANNLTCTNDVNNYHVLPPYTIAQYTCIHVHTFFILHLNLKEIFTSCTYYIYNLDMLSDASPL